MDSTQNFGLEKVWLKEILSWAKIPTRVKDFGLKMPYIGLLSSVFHIIWMIFTEIVKNSFYRVSIEFRRTFIPWSQNA